MDRRQSAGVMWIVAALLAIVTTVVFRVDPAQILATLVAGAVALGVGVWLLFGSSGAAIRLSAPLGVAWVVLFAALAAIQSDELAAWSTDVGVAVFGAVAALLANRSSGRSMPDARRT